MKFQEVGSTICLLEWMDEEKRFRVVYRTEVPRGEFAYDNAVNKIIELNEIFDPNFIYVDAGSGEYQVERLRLHGVQHPETNLHKKVQRVQFGESVKVIDPYTKVADKKPVKPFMVDQTQILFERDLIDINDSDTTVWKQLENYSVIRVGRQPVFTSENEHCVDALMLCVLGMTLNYPELANIIYKIKPTTKMAALKRNNHLDQALDSVKVDNKSKVGYLDRQDARDEIIKNCRRGARGSGIGWASRGARDFRPSTRRTW